MGFPSLGCRWEKWHFLRIIQPMETIRWARVNVYQKLSMITPIIAVLENNELDILRRSLLGRLLEMPEKPAWFSSFGLFLLGRQLEVPNPNEIGVLFDGTPTRFSLRKFQIVIGFPCRKYPVIKKKKKKGIGGKIVPFYSIMSGLEEDVTKDRLETILQKNKWAIVICGFVTPLWRLWMTSFSLHVIIRKLIGTMPTWLRTR